MSVALDIFFLYEYRQSKYRLVGRGRTSTSESFVHSKPRFDRRRVASLGIMSRFAAEVNNNQANTVHTNIVRIHTQVYTYTYSQYM